MGIAAGLVDDEHAPCRAGLDIDGVIACAIARDDQQVRCPPQQVLIDMEMFRQFIARGPDLIGVRGRQNRRRYLIKAFILEPVEAHIGPRPEHVGIDLVREIFDVEHALVVDRHC